MEASQQSRTLIANRYRILARIGEGGFGVVYKARDQQRHGKIVAIKEINMASLSAQEKIEVTDTFNREITLLSDLKHKNLPRIHNQFTDPEHWYIVMDYIEGQTLEELLARSSKGRLSVSEVVEIGITLCDVLSYLHDQKPSIIFRDVKPGNIMYTPWNHLYLIDFGIARRYRPGQAHDTGSLGSPGYAAPEQYGRAQTTLQTDIYGLGATLQTLLTGKEPLEIRLQGLPSDVPIPWKLQALFLQMMDQEPARRPRTMAEVKKSLIGLNTTLFSFSYLTMPFAYLGLIALNQSHFYSSPFMGLYSMLIPLLFIGYCYGAFIYSRHATPTRLSVKAMVLIARKQMVSFLFLLIFLTNGISLLYAAVTHPFLTTIHALFLWCDAVFLIVVALVSFLVWLKSRRQQLKSNQSAVQMSAPLQQQKRP